MNSPEKPRFEEIDSVTFDRIRLLIHSETGIDLKESKKILVSNRLRKRLIALKIERYEDYYELLEREKVGGTEMQYFIDAISTNETYFYRGSEQFDALRLIVLPKIFAAKSSVRIWSAGCSSGEEPYSIAIAAVETARSSMWHGRIEIIASDINTSVLAVARRGVYKSKSLRDLPEPYLIKYFQGLGDGYFEISGDMKKKIIFKNHNLLKDDPPALKFDVIFCRNVLMYFNRKTQEEIVVQKFAPALEANGYLFIGSSESFVGLHGPFKYANIKKSPDLHIAQYEGLRKMIRVMVVDDSPLFRRVLSDLLSGDPEIGEVVTAGDGNIALRKLKQSRPDVITMDIEMPGIGGLEVIEKILATHPTPIIIVSALGENRSALVLRAMELGVVDIIQKPGGTHSGRIDQITDLLSRNGEKRGKGKDETEAPGRAANRIN